MTFLLGVLLFAVGIAATIALHEWGHLTAARLCGMRVRRYFVGFGPTLYSFKRHHEAGGGHDTEYGIKAIPFGGFCDIAGMTAQDPLEPGEEPYAMYKKPWWQRIIVMLGGVTMNLIIGFLILYFIAVTWGLPNMGKEMAPRIQAVQCVSPAQRDDGTLEPCTGAGPAERAGVRPGDVIERVNGTKITSYPEAVSLIGSAASGDIELTLNRGGTVHTVTVTPEVVKRKTNDGHDIDQPAIGIAFQRPKTIVNEYNAVSAIGGAASFTGSLFGAVWTGLLSIPEKVPGIVYSIFGGQRDPASPMSVVGASRAGGELVEMNQWPSFFLLLANLNYFLAVFNLVPLPPLDGGHIAVVIYERIRDRIRRLLGKSELGPADYTRLMPVTLAFTAVLLVFGVLVMAADVVNPIVLNR
ncbi:MAG: M50 family metallopeptidase [Corynebacterium sp.]|uniref:M50 family metallopeptidase n=1 Tax=Corynebacterium sp. TaxID=1720 RepID=UPI0026DBCDFB|nr:M50 family metallopeptidase [Corynebacterium sp.]MDO5029279.1 M50 family metallopeptidase [Corynebacterium sp.]